MKRQIPNIGDRYGRLEIVSLEGRYINPKTGKIGDKLWKCKCDCGNIIITQQINLEKSTKSCGCYNKENRHLFNNKGKKWNHPSYGVYKSMLKRCYNKICKDYPDYGGRGITVCNRWLESINNFISDMGEKPEGMSIDRIDVNGNYEPSNCRWASNNEQAHNKRNNVLTEQQVHAIKVLLSFNEPQIKISKFFNVSPQIIYYIKKEKQWQAVKI